VVVVAIAKVVVAVAGWTNLAARASSGRGCRLRTAVAMAGWRSLLRPRPRQRFPRPPRGRAGASWLASLRAKSRAPRPCKGVAVFVGRRAGGAFGVLQGAAENFCCFFSSFFAPRGSFFSAASGAAGRGCWQRAGRRRGGAAAHGRARLTPRAARGWPASAWARWRRGGRSGQRRSPARWCPQWHSRCPACCSPSES
jgi:hypothetical protein